MVHPLLRKFGLTLMLALLLMLAISSMSAQADALIRLVHVVPGAPAIDVYTNGQLTAANLAYGENTPYINAPAGEHNISVMAAGTSDVIWEQPLTLSSGQILTLLASSAESPQFVGFEDNLEPLPLGSARFTTLHAIDGGPAVDVLLEDGRPLVLEQNYNQAYGTLDVPVFAYSLVVVPTGETVESALLAADAVPLNTNTSYMLVAYGTPTETAALLLSAPTAASAAGGDVRLVHGVQGGPTVEVYIDSILAAVLTNPDDGANATEYLPVPAGSYSVDLQADGASLTAANLTVNEGDRVTAVAIAADDGVGIRLFTDDVSTVTADMAQVRIINAGPAESTVSASLEDGTILGNDIAVGEASTASTVSPSTQNVFFTVSDGSGTTTLSGENTFYGGSTYDILVIGADSAAINTLAPVAIDQGIASAPGEPMVVMQEPTIAPTAPPAEAAATAQPTLAPVVTTTQSTDLPFGRVININPDANLRLRQYPDTEATTLHLVPPGTILTVNGREGEWLEGFPVPIPPGYDFIDPVEFLDLEDEDADLVAEETWLFVTFNTPDGGTISAWTRADFVDVRDAADEPVLLRDLPTIPGNQPGEARNTDITPPAGREETVQVRITNLSARLNVRRIPDTAGEVLARLSPGTVAEFVGLNEAQTWVYLRYTDANNCTVAGWASTDFIEYLYNGNPSNLDEIDERNLLAFTDEDTRGVDTACVQEIVAPTPDPTIDAYIATVALDPGANSNLRCVPDVNADVLAQIPTGTQLIIDGRTPDGNWLNVTFEGISGWIAYRVDDAIFLTLTLNGQIVEVDEVPVAENIPTVCTR